MTTPSTQGDVRLILRRGDGVEIKFDLPLAQIETATVIVYQGRHFSYQAFKWVQKEAHFTECAAPLVLGRLRPKVSEVNE
jgi:hypothetical protein